MLKYCKGGTQMILDYNNIEANYDEMISILTEIANECSSLEELENRIKHDYTDGYTARLHKHIAKQYGKEYLSQIGEDFKHWVGFINYMLETQNSSFLNKGLKTKNRKHFDRKAFWEKYVSSSC